MINNIVTELDKIKYGWKDKNNQIHYEVNDLFANNYVLSSPDEVQKSQVGVCWDQVELERKLFLESKINFNTYFIVHYDGKQCPTHTFLIYQYQGKYYWFEHAWEIFRGIHEYDSEMKALMDIKNKFIQHELNNNFLPKNLCIYQYEKPRHGIGCLAFYQHCENGKNIVL